MYVLKVSAMVHTRSRFKHRRKLLLLLLLQPFTALWILSGTTRVGQYQKGKTRKVKPIWIY